MAVAAAANVPLMQIVASIAVAVIVYVVAEQAQRDQTTVGGFVSFITAMLMLLAPLKRLTGVNAPLQRGLAAAESVFALIDESPRTIAARWRPDACAARSSWRACASPIPRPRVRRWTASISRSPRARPWRWSAPRAAARPRSPTCCRASTSPTKAHPLDGVDANDYRLASLRANIALVSQDVVLFNDTVAANIAYGAMRRVSEEEVVAAAEAAHAMDFIRDMPQGLQTLIGENGVRLSGGQRQRLAIARALLKDAPILILDEATSALDTETERAMQAALEKLMKGRTTLVIAHRLSTIENADRIVVLERAASPKSARTPN